MLKKSWIQSDFGSISKQYFEKISNILARQCCYELQSVRITAVRWEKKKELYVAKTVHLTNSPMTPICMTPIYSHVFINLSVYSYM